ncbi:Dehydrogenase (flavoprotein) [Micromonospora pattaloongensis]|uniref:Dehydrogenase (Flavoprotein) n=1 Tax=Micromonospora pattaloongensis TaxID=405436 RepID=A0A1H3JVW6_9ACTN|nr:NAD(P)/FAD-dependent oxidoreductase [Micromonospora pattaloongensis]SDY44021.1 Dehydrogenase (flavoprotein) [Micromonospora pattaloongensis]
MSPAYDVIVVGARCAGASTAMLLARQGRRVLLLDRAAIGSDTMSTLYIRPGGVALLARWGVLDAVVSSGCPPLDTIEYDVGEVRLASATPRTPGADAAYAPRRGVLDRLLVQAAAEAGAEVMDRTSVRELLRSGDRVTGVRVDGGDLTARLVVGADGMRSAVAEMVGAPTVVSDPLASCVYFTSWSGLRTGFGFHERPGSWIARIPTHDGLTIVSTYFPQQEFAQIRRDPLAAHLGAIRRHAPELYDQVADIVPTDRIHGTGDQRNFYRQAAGPGWVLVGDAGHHLDTITASGITNAFLQADLLAAELVGTDLDDHETTDAATARFGSQRDRATSSTYRSTLDLARLSLSPGRIDLLRTVATSPGATQRYFSMVLGILDAAEFFDDPELLDLL